jgi:hypothetical protein
VAIGGADAAKFSILAQPVSPVSGNGGTAAFTLRFTPDAVRSYSATVTVNSSDPANPAYSFAVSGKGVEWHGIGTIAASAAYAPKLGFSGANVYVLYYDSGPQKLMLIKSPDKGESWGAPFTVDGTPGDYSYSNSLAVDGSNLYIAYNRVDSLYFIEVADSGTTLSSSNAKTLSAALSGYGYDNSITYDAQNVYVAYSAAGPAFTYAPKGAALNFHTPVLIDSSLQSGGNRWPTSILIDSNGSVNVAYYDDTSQLKCAVFAVTDTLPMVVSGLDVAHITSANTPSAATSYLISFYDPTAKSYKLYEHYSYVSGLNLFFKSNTVAIDSGSSNVGSSGNLLLQGTTLYSSYYDTANKSLKFATGLQATPSTDYAFSSSVIATVGGANFSSSFASDPATNTFYVAYYDSTGSGALKIAKSLTGGATW